MGDDWKKAEKALRKIDGDNYLFFPTRGRRDPDNYSGKFILDGLVQAGIIKDDSFECINLRLKASYDKDNPRTEIEVEEQ